MFVSSTTLLCLYVLASCLINIKRIMNIDNCSIWRAIEKSPVSGILVMYTFVVCWFVGGLTAFHLYLIATNQVFISSKICFSWCYFLLMHLQFDYLFSLRRRHMKIFVINMIKRWTRITLDVLEILRKCSFPRYPVPGINSGQRQKGIYPQALLTRHTWAKQVQRCQRRTLM